MTRHPTSMRVKRLSASAVIPERAHSSDAGLDLSTLVDVHLAPGERCLVPTGIAVEIPEGWCGLICPRSGLAARNGIGVVNGPGVIDAGYRGEIQVVLVNHDLEHAVVLAAGDRIAQLVIIPVLLGEIEVVDELSQAQRNDAGFGSTGASQILSKVVD